MSSLLNGKIAFVTGAGSGLGRSISEVFARHGATVALFDRNPVGGQESLELVRAVSPKSSFHELDVADVDAIQAAFAEAAAHHGGVDVLVAAAGVREITDVLDITPGEWRNVIDINLSGVFFCCQAAARLMRDSGTGGSLISISSVAGLIGFSHRPAYTAAKHGIVGMTKSLAKDLAPYGIRSNAICPGLIRTPLTQSYFADEHFQRSLELTVPQGRNGEPEEIANAAVYLASDLASYVNGVALPVDGGWAAEKGFDVSGADNSAYYSSGNSTSTRV